jgi:1,4-dihydroxy-6-naphthoate synthase
LVLQSIQYGLDHREDAIDYAMKYGRGIDRKLADRFIGMYVNDWTRDYGPAGRKAVVEFLKAGWEAKILPKPAVVEFVEL